MIEKITINVLALILQVYSVDLTGLAEGIVKVAK